MIEKAAIKNAVRFGISAAVASFLVILAVYFSGNSPYGKYAFYALFLLPLFLFWNLAHFKKYTDPELKFFKGLKISWLTSLVAAVIFAILIYIFSISVGASGIQLYIQEMRAMMVQSKTQFLNLPNGKEIYELNYKKLDQITANALILDNFLKMFVIGFLFSFVSATFYRK